MNRILANILIVLVLAGLAGATGYVVMKSREEVRNNELLTQRFLRDVADNPAPALERRSADADAQRVPGASSGTSTVPVIKDWQSYQNAELGISLQYPPGAKIEDAAEHYWPDVPNHRGIMITIDDFADLRYETLSRKQIFAGVDKDRTAFAACVEGETEKKIRPDGTVLHKVPIVPDCALDGCSLGYHYKIYGKGVCYDAAIFMLQANPGKIYDASDPKLHLADEQNLTAKSRIYDIGEKIVSTLVWTK